MVVMKIILNRGTIIIIRKAPLLFLCAELTMDLITAAANGAGATVILVEGGGRCVRVVLREWPLYMGSLNLVGASAVMLGDCLLNIIGGYQDTLFLWLC